MNMSKDNRDAPKNWRSVKTLKSLLIVNSIIAAIITISFHPDKATSLAIFNEWREFLYSFIISLALSYGISVIVEFTDTRISWIHEPLKRLIVELLSVTAYAFIVGFLFATILLWGFYDFTFDTLPWDNILRNTRWPIIISLIVTIAFTTRAFLFEWRTAAIASEKLRADRFQGQYQSLKNQLNPHFLFNSLNTLSNLVYDDQEKAIVFIQKLSKIYRYVIEVQQEELVTVSQELSFLENYLGLQKLRFGDNLQVEINVENQEALIPPLSLQLLLENAIKHNIISSDDPLHIEIIGKEDSIIVRNNLQIKDIKENSTGIGLENIRSRLSYFSDESLKVTQNEKEFIVELPIMKSA
jgi:hypothetical protein